MYLDLQLLKQHKLLMALISVFLPKRWQNHSPHLSDTRLFASYFPNHTLMVLTSSMIGIGLLYIGYRTGYLTEIPFISPNFASKTRLIKSLKLPLIFLSQLIYISLLEVESIAFIGRVGYSCRFGNNFDISKKEIDVEESVGADRRPQKL